VRRSSLGATYDIVECPIGNIFVVFAMAKDATGATANLFRDLVREEDDIFESDE